MPFTFQVRTDYDSADPVAGADSVVLVPPARWYARGRVLAPVIIARDLRGISFRLADGIGERLHHANWVITPSPDLVLELAVMHRGCERCHRDAGRAATYIRRNPGAQLAVGQLYWARV